MPFDLIRIDSISKRYGKSGPKVLDRVELNIKSGTTIGVLGPNGAGKSTLVSIICGILEPNEGSVTFMREDGQSISGKELKHLIGYVPQDFAFYEDLTLRQNINYFGGLYGLSKEDIRKASERLTTAFGLDDQLGKRLRSFSGGMKRRTNLLLSLLHDPKILFLDEPTAGVDVHNKHKIINHLKRLKEQGLTIFYSSHYLEEAEQLCDQIALLHRGRIIVDGTLRDVLDAHQLTNLESLFLDLTTDTEN